MSFDILSAGAHGAVVLPVPARPRVDAVHGDLFGYLDKATRPLVRIVHEPPPTGGLVGGAAPTGVHVISNRRIGGYQVATLGAGSHTGALSAWLDGHGYRLPHGARPIIASYVRRGWSFVAVRLAKRADGALTPLRIRFAAAQPIYPMRLEQLGAEPVSVDLYVVADHRTRIPALGDTYAGPVAELRPAAPAALRRYLTGAWITREQSDALEPATLTHDFVAHRASADEPFRAVVDEVHYDAPASTSSSSSGGSGSDGGSSGWVLTGVATLLLALGALVVRRHRGPSSPRT